MPLLDDKQVATICNGNSYVLAQWQTIAASLRSNSDPDQQVAQLNTHLQLINQRQELEIFPEYKICEPRFSAIIAQQRKMLLLEIINAQIIAISSLINLESKQIQQEARTRVPIFTAAHTDMTRLNDQYENKLIAGTFISGGAVFSVFLVGMLAFSDRARNDDNAGFNGIFLFLSVICSVVSYLKYRDYNAIYHENAAALHNKLQQIQNSIAPFDNDVYRITVVSRVNRLQQEKQIRASAHLNDNCPICLDKVEAKQNVHTAFYVSGEEQSLLEYQGPYHKDCLVQYEKSQDEKKPLRDPVSRMEACLTPRGKHFRFFVLPPLEEVAAGLAPEKIPIVVDLKKDVPKVDFVAVEIEGQPEKQDDRSSPVLRLI